MPTQVLPQMKDRMLTVCIIVATILSLPIITAAWFGGVSACIAVFGVEALILLGLSIFFAFEEAF